MMSTQQPTNEPLPGDYYGTVYKGGFLLPVFGFVLVVVGIWWFTRKRRK